MIDLGAFKTIPAAAIAAMLLSTAPAAAAPGDTDLPTQGSEAFVIPFGPEAGSVYRITTTESSKDGTDGDYVTEMVTVETLTFVEPNEIGWRVTSKGESFDIQNGGAFGEAFERAVADLNDHVSLLNFNESGEPVSQDNLDETRAIVANLVDDVEDILPGLVMEMMEEDGAAPEDMPDIDTLIRAVRASLQPMLELDDESFFELNMEGFLSMFGLGGISLELDETYLFEDEVELPLVGLPVATESSLLLRRPDPGTLTLATETYLDEADTTAAMQQYAQRVMTSMLQEEEKEEAIAALEALPPISVSVRSLLTLDAMSGMPRSYVEEKTATSQDESETERTEILLERIQ